MKIVAMGMSCPLGLRWQDAAAAVRAGVVAFEELDYIDDDGEAITGAALARLDQMLAYPGYRARATQLLAWSINQALVDVPLAQRAGLPVVLALPTGMRSSPEHNQALIEALASCNAPVLGLQAGMVARAPGGGASAGMRALDWARSYLDQAEYCLVAAADSLIGARPLAELARERRLLTQSNPDGVIPGEGAAAVLLTRGRAQSALAEIHGLGFHQEPGLLENDVPLRAEGVLGASRQALADAGWEPGTLDLRISDAAGDSYAFKEQALLLARLLRSPKAELPLWLPANCLGHMGVAAGLCGVVLATEAFACHQAPGPRTICFAGDNRGERAALVLSASAKVRN